MGTDVRLRRAFCSSFLRGGSSIPRGAYDDVPASDRCSSVRFCNSYQPDVLAEFEALCFSEDSSRVLFVCEMSLTRGWTGEATLRFPRGLLL